MAPVRRRASSMHTTAGTALQYRHAQKLSDFIIGWARSLALFYEPQNSSNHSNLNRLANSGVRFTLQN